MRYTSEAVAAAHREKVAFLTDPRHFPGSPRAVAILETHFAWVFLGPSRVLKLKKPLCQASMDYRTVASRERACRAELRLNRRLAPGVYLRAVPLRRSRSGALTFRGGRIVDWLVEMRRLPAARMLDRALVSDTVGAADMDRVVARLARFFARAERRPMTDRAYLGRLRRQILDNSRELNARDLRLSRRRVGEVAQSQLEFLGLHAQLFAGRGGRLLDGHGDLRPEHVFLGTPSSSACVIDCLEFDPDLRRLDPAEEIAFLALECTRLGGARIAGGLVRRYRRVTGDPAPETLLHFYMSRRAAERAKIAAWHLRDEAFASQSRSWRDRAHSYLAAALRHSRRAAALAHLTASSGSLARRPASGTDAGARPARAVGATTARAGGNAVAVAVGVGRVRCER